MNFLTDPIGQAAAKAKQFRDGLRRQRARRELWSIGDLVRRGFGRIEYRPRHHDRALRSQLKYDRLDPNSIRFIETLLAKGYPSFNRAQRRHLARGHRYMAITHP